LGCIVAEILVRAGIGKVDICDCGIVDEPDLNRQTLYYEFDLRKRKIDIACHKLNAINSEVVIRGYDSDIRCWNSFNFDGNIIIDCLDNFTSRRILYDLIPANTFYIHGGIDAFTGQVITLLKGKSIDFSHIFAGVEDKSDIAVTPEVVHILAGFMCKEFFSLVCGKPKLLNRFLIVDFENMETNFLPLY
jgi:adenylyltransferase/sulfurtransferase